MFCIVFSIYAHKSNKHYPFWPSFILNEISKTESVQKSYTHITCNGCNIHNTPYLNRLVKLTFKSLDYGHYEFNLITQIKLINGISKLYFAKCCKYYQTNYLLGGFYKKHFNDSKWQNYFFKWAVNQWNNLPSEIFFCEKIEHFLTF